MGDTFSHIPYPQIQEGSLLDAEEEILHLARAVYRSSLFRWQHLYQWQAGTEAPYDIILNGAQIIEQYEGREFEVQSYTYDSQFVETELLEPVRVFSCGNTIEVEKRWILPHEKDQEQRYWVDNLDLRALHTHHLEHRKRERHYWPKKNRNGGRFSVSIRRFSWRGPLNTLLWVPDFHKRAYHQFIKDLKTKNIEIKTTVEDPTKPMRFWQRFILLRIKKSGKIIAIDPDFYEIGTWRVFVPRGDGTIEKCVITFRKNHDQDGLDLFPSGAFKELCHLLDRAIGIPHGWQGTFDSIGRLRGNVTVTLTNIATRPWVFMDPKKSYTDYCYNTPERLEEGLKNWSKKYPNYAKLYAQIKQLYPEAQKNLAHYYQGYLKVDKKTAQRYAKRVVAIVYGAHFRF